MGRSFARWGAGVLVLGALGSAAAEEPAGLPPGYQLVYEQTFDEPDVLKGFTFTDPTAWKRSEKGALELAKQSQYQPPVRSPLNIALISEYAFEDFVLEADFVQTGREYGHRDMCIFFGFEGPSHFYYVHMATKADPNAHNVFIVDGKPRTNIARQTTEGVNWGLNIWHRVRLERTVAEGTIRVFFDDMKTPIMVAQNDTFKLGHIGFGSFDDTGMVDNIRIWAPHVERRSPPAFK